MVLLIKRWLVDVRTLVTGGSGFIGTNLIESLINDNHIVLNLDIVPPRNGAHRRFFKQLNILDCESLQAQLIEFKPDIIYHMAARTDLDGKTLADYAANTDGLKTLISALKLSHGLKCIVFASSRLVCRIGYQPDGEDDYCPDTVYGESKVQGEKIIKSLSAEIPCRWLIVRPTSIWGPWFDVPYKNFFLSIINGHYLHPKVERILKSFGYVGNAVYQMRSLCEVNASPLDGKVFYMADYPPIDVINMANLIQNYADSRPLRIIPIQLLRVLAWLGDLLRLAGYRRPPLTSFRLNNLLTPMIYDLDPMEKAIGLLPFTLQQGIAETVDWLKIRGDIN